MGAIERGQWVIVAAYALIGIATFLIAQMLVQEQEARAAQDNLDDRAGKGSSNPLVRLTRPIFAQYFVPMVRGKKFWDNSRKIYRRKLISSGLRDELTADEMIAFKFFLILFFPVVGGALKSGGFLDVGGWLILASSVLGWFYPDLWVNGRIKKRHQQIRKSMPFIVDLLALSTEAGMDFVGAIGKVVEKAASSPLVDELEQLLKEIKVGSSRTEAMREMALRVGMTEVNSFVAILISADQMGASIGKILRQQSDQIRSARFLMAEKVGAAASQKLILPIIFVILPAVLIMIIAPFFLGASSGGGF